jgi:hypothetical protein
VGSVPNKSIILAASILPDGVRNVMIVVGTPIVSHPPVGAPPPTTMPADPARTGTWNPKARGIVEKYHPKGEPPGGRGRPTLLNEQVTRIICENIRRGAFTWVACQAVGISTDTYSLWVRRGIVGEQPYKDFLDAIEQAHAEARVAAEQSVYAANPLAWLKMGPGRDRPGRPGWSDRPIPEVTPGSDAPVRVTLNLGERVPESLDPGPDPVTATDLSPQEERMLEMFLLPAPPPPPAPAGQDPLDD